MNKERLADEQIVAAPREDDVSAPIEQHVNTRGHGLVPTSISSRSNPKASSNLSRLRYSWALAAEKVSARVTARKVLYMIFLAKHSFPDT